MSSLKENPEIFQIALRSYVTEENGGIDKIRLRALMIGMATENLVHLVWRVENNQKDEKTLDEIHTFIKNVEDALRIEEYFVQKTDD